MAGLPGGGGGGEQGWWRLSGFFEFLRPDVG